MAFRISRRKKVSVMRVGMKVIGTVLGLYVSGYGLEIVGQIMMNQSSPFFEGLALIGWTVSDSVNGTATSCGAGHTGCDSCISNCVTSTNGTGILSVIGLLAIVWILFEFVEVRF